MASRLANRHIELNAELRRRTVQRLTRVWNSLPEYRNQTLQAWLLTAVPLVQAAQRAEVTLTQSYLARALDRPVVGVDIEDIVRNARNGATHEEVYARPFKEVWIALANGTPFDAAKAQGLARATSLAATDIQLAMTNTLTAVGGSEEVIWGYQRVADGAACEYCLLLDGAQFRTDDPMPIHPSCGCGVEPVVYTRGFDNRNNLETFNKSLTGTPKGVDVTTHGEMGPVIGDPSHTVTQL